MISNDSGYIVENAWKVLADLFLNIQLDSFVVMPDHVHGIIGIPRGGCSTKIKKNRVTLGEVVGAFKSMATARVTPRWKYFLCL